MSNERFDIGDIDFGFLFCEAKNVERNRQLRRSVRTQLRRSERIEQVRSVEFRDQFLKYMTREDK